MDHIFGYIERITFYNSDTGFTVARLKMPRKNELITLVGTLPALQPGESVRCLGHWKTNPSHGVQFEVKECTIEAPCDLLGIQKYLESGMVRGIGPVYAEKIIKEFGVKTLDVIDQNPEALLNIPGIGEKRVEKIKECWGSQKAIREVMIFLQKYEVSPAFAQKIYKLYGVEAIDRLKENPFELARKITGVGFKTADKIAMKMGFLKEASQRIDSGIEFVLQELASEGHTCYPIKEFLSLAETILEVPPTLIEERIHALCAEQRIVVAEEYIWHKGLYLCETGIAREIERIKAHSSRLRQIDTEKAIQWVQEKLHLELAEHQKLAVISALQEKILIITGGPGTGKSTITKAILAITKELTRSIILAAPTGKAAKRMSEITKKEASTIHSLLQYDFVASGFKRNKENPLECDLIIIDEASMIDTSLMYHLLKAIPNQARVIFVGDIHQLPSVGPGNVLKDMIDSESICVKMLTEIFRQARGSKIITNAHKINEGQFPDLKNEFKSDFFFVKAEEPEDVKAQILDLVRIRLPKKYHFDPIDDIQVLAPMKKGIIGTENLNLALQEVLNPNKDYLFQGGSRFATQDKVMQIRNDYNKEVYNGDIGRILKIDRNEHEVKVSFDGKEVIYPFHDLDNLVLAYTTSIHKYQGCECPCVVIPIHTTHFVMLHRNLLYTGVTRGKKLVVLVGIPKAIAIAVSNDEVKKRHTFLQEQLKNQEVNIF